MIIVLFFDDKYFHFAKPLLSSIKIHEPSAGVYINGFNLTHEQVEELKSYKCVKAVKNEKLKFDPSIADTYNKGLNRGKPLRFQLTCQRGRYMLDAMNAFPTEKLFIISDVDTLMIQPLTELKHQMKNHDIGIVRVSDTKICSGFFAVSSTKNGKLYLKNFYDTAMDGRLFLCKDQKTMAKIHEKLKDEIKFLYIDRRYLDHSCGDDAFMWSGHKSAFGTKEQKYQKYLRKLKAMK